MELKILQDEHGRIYYGPDGHPLMSDFATIVNFFGWLAMMAAPKLWAALPRIPPKTFLLNLLDGFLPYAVSKRYMTAVPEGETPVDTSQRGPAATRLRELLEQWEPPQMTPEIREAARVLLLADGAKEPPCGWNEYAPDPDIPIETTVIWPETI
jgi:hypothetical protein